MNIYVMYVCTVNCLRTFYCVWLKDVKENSQISKNMKSEEKERYTQNAKCKSYL